MVMPADRLTTLEIRFAEAERTIEELSGQIAEQWKLIETMRRQLEQLGPRFIALEEAMAPRPEITKPPHY